ncbi:MAG: undecaprenyl/decaprenyl-phosphate alpha-N-acetylglucosaminyl 1-phosphate transferase [Actinobacteria bacterium]|nr:undecaprenyl/decaprenyl-phosphate alpha-N-acetylglucosaminyl 1-phosphate transferase [Actinomycetota bacterium]
MRAYVFVLLVAFAVTYLTTPLVRRLARRVGAITPVRDRDVHSVPVPRMGGLAMFLGFAVALLVASRTPFLDRTFENGGAPWGVLLGAGTVCALGVADDLWTLDAVTKLAGQSLAAGLMAWQGGVQLVALPLGGQTIISRNGLIVLTIVAVVVAVNAVNFVDGLDGLAAGIVAIAGAAFFVYSYLLSRYTFDPTDYSSLATLVTAATVGCCLGFLPHNFNPARVFMGDSGSMLIGLLLATSTISITGQFDPGELSNAQVVPAFLPLVLPLAVLALPLVDMGWAIVRRVGTGKSPFTPDKLHLHHRLLRLGHSHANAVLVMYVWTATFAFGVASSAFLEPMTALVLGLAAVTAAVLVTLGPLRGRWLGGRARRGHVS